MREREREKRTYKVNSVIKAKSLEMETNEKTIFSLSKSTGDNIFTPTYTDLSRALTSL